MKTDHLQEKLNTMIADLNDFHPEDWGDIVSFLKQIKKQDKPSLIPVNENHLRIFANGVAFITYAYGIDGVSIEISKYGHTLYNLLSQFGKPAIHLIGGNIDPRVVSIMGDDVKLNQIDGIDGWDKWDEGIWFTALFREQMSSLSSESAQLAKETYKQAAVIANRLGEYFLNNQISLIIPVNVASNPGNLALTLGLVFVTEFLGTYVLNSNHDFYWESGKPSNEREPGEKPGIRDHFFRNIKNKTFFSMFRRLYPWNGCRWLQVNINARQSRMLINRFDFPKGKVTEISTSISDSYFEPYDKEDVSLIRQRMGLILSHGDKNMRPVPVDIFLSRVDHWMGEQEPIIIGSRESLTVDSNSDDLIILLQPTRIVDRKRIYRNLELISSLLKNSKLKDEFKNNQKKQLILHITGPVPKEHQSDLEEVLHAYKEKICTLPGILADRIFISFSVGRESHISFNEPQFDPMRIEEIYRMADAVVFPSETEGRGLPIIEACACGIPIICSQYNPKEVFDDVIGENLPKKLRIQYTLFPEGRLNQAFLSEVANILIHPETYKDIKTHNLDVVRSRYSQESFKSIFVKLIKQLVDEE